MNKIKSLVISAIMVLVLCGTAFAYANPFSDVPKGNWAYDSVAYLASRGVVSGYPDGLFKGDKPATRYELASVVARALVQVDMTKADKRDVELLKKLVMEFKDELDALGVRVDKLDKRVAVLEDRLGGWKLNGTFWFDAKTVSDAQHFGLDSNNYNSNGDKNSFETARFRLYLTKYINDNTYFFARLTNKYGTRGNIGEDNLYFDNFYVQTVLPWSINTTIGRFNTNWESEIGLYNTYEWDSLFGDMNLDGFRFSKDFGKLNAIAVFGRNNSFGQNEIEPIDGKDSFMTYAGKLQYTFNEKFTLGAMGYIFDADNGNRVVFDTIPAEFTNVKTLGGYTVYNFTPNVSLKGVYYWQSLNGINVVNDTPTAWKAMLNVDQKLLKFTSLWVEYSKQDNTFMNTNEQYNWTETGNVFANKPWNDETTSSFLVRADQKWNDKFSSFLRYAQFDFGTNGIDDTKNYTVGFNYQYMPALGFQLAYDYIDYGKGVSQSWTDSESIVRFRTVVNF